MKSEGRVIELDLGGDDSGGSSHKQGHRKHEKRIDVLRNIFDCPTTEKRRKEFPKISINVEDFDNMHSRPADPNPIMTKFLHSRFHNANYLSVPAGSARNQQYWYPGGVAIPILRSRCGSASSVVSLLSAYSAVSSGCGSPEPVLRQFHTSRPGTPSGGDTDPSNPVTAASPMNPSYFRYGKGGYLSFYDIEMTRGRLDDTETSSTSSEPQRRSLRVKRGKRVAVPELEKPTVKTDIVEEDESPEERRQRLRRCLKRAIVVVRINCFMAIAMRRTSIASTGATLMSELHYFTANVDNTTPPYNSLAFDKMYFSRKSALQLPSWARLIGKTNPAKRSEEDVQQLYKVLSTMKCLQKFHHNIKVHLCRVAQYISCEQGRVILRQGHRGFFFYLVYSGSVFVQFDDKDVKTGQRIITTTDVVMGSGSSFGELALLGDGRRTASIICREKSELFQIEKDTFMEICTEKFHQELAEKVNFLRKFPIFEGWEDGVLTQVCFEGQITEIPHGKIIERNTAATEFLYFVMKGKVQMLREISLDKKSLESILAQVEDDDPDPPSPNELLNNAKLKTNNETHHLRPKHLNDLVGTVLNDAYKCYAAVGLLQTGDHSEFVGLTPYCQAAVRGVILVSQGAVILRIVKRRLYTSAPKGKMEQFEKSYRPREIPSDTELYKKFVEDQHWSLFKKNVIATLLSEQRGEFLSLRPSTSKGSTGWARWPGVQRRSDSGSTPTTQTDTDISGGSGGGIRCSDLHIRDDAEDNDSLSSIRTDDLASTQSETSSRSGGFKKTTKNNKDLRRRVKFQLAPLSAPKFRSSHSGLGEQRRPMSSHN